MADKVTCPYNLRSKEDMVEVPVQLQLSDDNRFMSNLVASDRTHTGQVLHRGTSHSVMLTSIRKVKVKHRKWSHACTLIKVPVHTTKVMILGVSGTFMFAVCALPMAKPSHIRKLIVKINSKNLMFQKMSKCGYYMGWVLTRFS